MITIGQYFGKWLTHPDATPERKLNAKHLLDAVGRLEAMAREDGVVFIDNPTTKSGVSGETYGGFRPQACPIGAANSAHKQGLAVDRYDPDGSIDAWCMAHADKLKACGIYIEHPNATEGWSHWTIRPLAGRVNTGRCTDAIAGSLAPSGLDTQSEPWVASCG